MNAFKLILVILSTTTLFSCGGGEKKKPIYVEAEDFSAETDNSSYSQNGDEVVVPFRYENGIKYVQVKVNGVGFEMIFDTGCSSALISRAEAEYLLEKGKLTPEDILGTAPMTVADGSVSENMVVNLKEVVINDQIRCTDVQAIVSDNIAAPLLLGNEVLDRVASVKIDNEQGVLIFKLK